MSSNSLKISVSGMFVLLTLQLAASASVIFSLPQQIVGAASYAALCASILIGVVALPLWACARTQIKHEQKKYVRAALENASLRKETARILEENRVAEKANGLYRQVAMAVAEKETLVDLASFYLKEICLFADWPVGQAFVRDAKTGGMRALQNAKYCRNPGDCAAFFRAGKETIYKEGAGAVGRAARDGIAKWAPETPYDEPEIKKDAAAACGLRGVYVFPVTVAGVTELVFEFYLAGAARPDGAMLKCIAKTGAYLSMYMQRRIVERQLEEEKLCAERNARARADVMCGVSSELLSQLDAIEKSANMLQRPVAESERNQTAEAIRRHTRDCVAMLNDVSRAFDDATTSVLPAQTAFSPRTVAQHVLSSVKSRRYDIDVLLNASSDLRDMYHGDAVKLTDALKRLAKRVTGQPERARLTLRISENNGDLHFTMHLTTTRERYNILEKGFWGRDVDFAICRAAATTLGGRLNMEYDAVMHEMRISLAAPMRACKPADIEAGAIATQNNDAPITFTPSAAMKADEQPDANTWRYACDDKTLCEVN